MGERKREVKRRRVRERACVFQFTSERERVSLHFLVSVYFDFEKCNRNRFFIQISFASSKSKKKENSNIVGPTYCDAINFPMHKSCCI